MQKKVSTALCSAGLWIRQRSLSVIQLFLPSYSRVFELDLTGQDIVSDSLMSSAWPGLRGLQPQALRISYLLVSSYAQQLSTSSITCFYFISNFFFNKGILPVTCDIFSELVVD